ncbi:MAG: transposase [Planctomycetes bacterium]|nr:transposase [Planctomycetota bacterium]
MWHHVMNRGVARRTLFESNRDIRMFLARIALEVRARRLEVHAYCILTTHFHLLVRSTSGELSGVMQHIQNDYSRWFNRARRRDGPLYRSRFRSKPVRSERYRRLLVRYIDNNPVSAGLVRSTEEYPHGSSRAYAHRQGPIWLERSWVESVVRERTNADQYDPEGYKRVFAARSHPHGLALVERRVAFPFDTEDPLDDLLNGAIPHVRSWMLRKAGLADGTVIGLPVCDVESVTAVLDNARTRIGAWEVSPERRAVDAWPIACVGLLRDLCGSTLIEAGMRSGRTSASAWVLENRHRRLLKEAPAYADRLAALAHLAIKNCHHDALRCGSESTRQLQAAIPATAVDR